jgi:hypothetical protein
MVGQTKVNLTGTLDNSGMDHQEYTGDVLFSKSQQL